MDMCFHHRLKCSSTQNIIIIGCCRLDIVGSGIGRCGYSRERIHYLYAVLTNNKLMFESSLSFFRPWEIAFSFFIGWLLSVHKHRYSDDTASSLPMKRWNIGMLLLPSADKIYGILVFIMCFVFMLYAEPSPMLLLLCISQADSAFSSVFKFIFILHVTQMHSNPSPMLPASALVALYSVTTCNVAICRCCETAWLIDNIHRIACAFEWVRAGYPATYIYIEECRCVFMRITRRKIDWQQNKRAQFLCVHPLYVWQCSTAPPKQHVLCKLW